MFSRFAAELARRGARPVVMLPDGYGPLGDILRTLDAVEANTEGVDLAALDCFEMLLSLPFRFGTEHGTIPPPARRRADPGRAANWRAALEAHSPGAMRVGIHWIAGPRLTALMPKANTHP